MEAYQFDQLKILTASIVLIFRYQLRKRSLWQKMQALMPKKNQTREIYKNIVNFQQDIDEKETYEARFFTLIRMLDGYRYYFSVHAQNEYLFTKILNAMIAALFFNEAHVAAYQSLIIENNNIPFYLEELTQDELLATYEQFYREQHAILGRRKDRLKISDIELYAKQGMINGKLFDLWGEADLIKHGLTYLQQELQSILDKHHFVGFLTKEHLEGYLDKIALLKYGRFPAPFVQPPVPPIQPKEETLLQYARYLIENIMNACGVAEEDRARYPEHRCLVKACFWVDEMLKGVKGEFEVIVSP